MSNQINTELYERAADVITYFEGTLVQDAIEKAMADGDLERLLYIVTESEAEIAQQEFYDNDIY